ncbi:MAG TPA: DUF2252 family protein [Polyangia bacterium]|nr:DUF2252 family protein [Polyangia bacterium]
MARPATLVAKVAKEPSPRKNDGKSAAGAPSESRSDWLRRALLDRERALLDRDASLVAGKFAKMAKTPFAFFRGTPWMAMQQPSPFQTAAASQVAVMGDPHPENVGIVAGAQGVRQLEFNDFDLADFGSYLDDLRRLASGFWIVTEMGKLKAKKQAEVIEEVVDGYVAEVQALSRGERPSPLTVDTLGDILPAILNEADEPLDAKDPGSKADQALVREILKGYATSLRQGAGAAKDMVTIKRLARRHAGVSSYPLLRFRVLVEGPSAGAPDEWVLEIKESKGAPATRVIAIQKQFRAGVPADAFLGWASVGGQEFRVRRVESDERRISAEQLAKRIKKDDLRKRDLKTLASALGRLLARGHCQALDRNGKPGLRAIADALGAKGDLKEEVVGYAERMGAQVLQDYDLFRGLLASQGATLGWRAGTK